MKLYRIAWVLLFVAAAALFGVTYYGVQASKDNTLPQISIDTEMLDVKTNVTNKDLMRGVTAFDGKDGDITDNVIIENISRFREKGVCKVTYAVCDSNNHVARATRKIRYTDYKSPVFTLKTSLCFSVYNKFSVKNCVGATDMIDGDIEKSVIITSADFDSTGSVAAGVYTINVKVTNSKGDTVTADLPVIVEDRSSAAPVINLKEYLIYLKKTDTFDAMSLFDSVVDANGLPLELEVVTESNLERSIPGTYTVHYYATDAAGRTGHSILAVIVE